MFLLLEKCCIVMIFLFFLTWCANYSWWLFEKRCSGSFCFRSKVLHQNILSFKSLVLFFPSAVGGFSKSAASKIPLQWKHISIIKKLLPSRDNSHNSLDSYCYYFCSFAGLLQLYWHQKKLFNILALCCLVFCKWRAMIHSLLEPKRVDLKTWHWFVFSLLLLLHYHPHLMSELAKHRLVN